ncbi:WH2 domain-containing protein [Trichonephila inaurata madagascariensis]|uniref:WH2 domain-containing protein n=1 Tax=Trichonephila inaurata madagascariensis TaxID=2747483 RepID=A0A8X7CV47_9ARAC|nr:WH2 domain-containing protein [Trichonephila inaurata madagascariensis]
MMTSNNSPLLKDSQELTKTKGTIWKPLIAVSLLSVFSFISGQYLPYVIIAVSGSGPIAAVPLAIFAVSTVVVLVSTIYLIRLAVSRADNKKEEPQKFVCENCTNLENKSSVPTPTPPPVTFGTQPNPSANMLQPPPPPLSSCAPPPPPPMPTPDQLNQASGAVPPPPPPPMPTPDQLNQASGAVPPPPPPQNSSTQQGSNDLLNSIKKAGGKAGMSKEQKKARDEKLKQNREKREKNSEGEQTDFKNALFAEIRGGFKLKPVNKNQQSPEKSTPKTKCDMAFILARRIAIEFSDSESEHSDSISDSGWTTDESKDKQKEIEQKKKVLTKSRKKSTPSNSQSDNKKGTSTPESGYRSDDDQQYPETAAPPSHQPNTKKPPIPPKSAGLQTKPEAPPASQVNEMQDPSILSVKERAKMFGNRK